VLEGHRIGEFERLFERVETDKVEAMIEESKDDAGEPKQSEAQEADTPVKPECTIDDFAKLDLRIAKVVKAEPVEGADKLLRLELDVGTFKKHVFAGIAQAYKPEELVGKTVVVLANLKPRKMRFGVSEGMILAAGGGGKDLFMLTADEGAQPGRQIS
jgi:methionyl-tRNA synthetase